MGKISKKNFFTTYRQEILSFMIIMLSSFLFILAFYTNIRIEALKEKEKAFVKIAKENFASFDLGKCSESYSFLPPSYKYKCVVENLSTSAIGGYEIVSDNAEFEMMFPIFPEISDGMDMKLKVYVPEDNETDYGYGFRRGNTVISVKTFKNGLIRFDTLSNIKIASKKLTGDFNAEINNTLKIVKYDKPKTIEIYADGDKNGLTGKNDYGEMFKVFLPYETKILSKRISFSTENPKLLRQSVYQIYLDYSKKYGILKANKEFLGVESNNVFSQEAFFKTVAKLIKDIEKEIHGSDIYPLYLFAKTVALKKGSCIEETLTLKKGKEPLGITYLNYLSSINYDKAMQEIENRYRIVDTIK